MAAKFLRDGLITPNRKKHHPGSGCCPVLLPGMDESHQRILKGLPFVDFLKIGKGVDLRH